MQCLTGTTFNDSVILLLTCGPAAFSGPSGLSLMDHTETTVQAEGTEHNQKAFCRDGAFLQAAFDLGVINFNFYTLQSAFSLIKTTCPSVALMVLLLFYNMFPHELYKQWTNSWLFHGTTTSPDPYMAIKSVNTIHSVEYLCIHASKKKKFSLWIKEKIMTFGFKQKTNGSLLCRNRIKCLTPFLYNIA